jgi:hypothetical protein
MRLANVLVLACALVPAFAQNRGSAFIGRWNFNITTPTGTRASWLGISEKNGRVEVWYQPTGGNVYQIKDFKLDGSRLTMTVSRPSPNRPGPPVTWELEAQGDKLAGFQKRGETSVALAGMRAPELKRSPPKSWTTPEPLFNGRDLSGWEPIGNRANSHWVVRDGLLVNEARGANLKTTRTFDDFKLHFEVVCPERANSGMYLRGRYEIQLEAYPPGDEPAERAMGSIYGRIAPKTTQAPKPGEWETFDVTLVGRTLTLARNGVTIIDRQEIEGITGGALDANEGEPGPFYIQGDHTGGLKFRNITISLPQR